MKIDKIIFSITIFIILLECFLRWNGKYQTTNERSYGKYMQRYRVTTNSWFHTWKPNLVLDYKQSEFHYTNIYNDLGHREHHFSEYLKDTSTHKIIALGDSFTEGDGSCYDSTWVKSLACALDKKFPSKFSFYNAGVCGSDVFYNNKILVSKLVQLKPKVVIECLNTSDIDDVICNGGKERFNEDGTTSGKVGPKWELPYKYSHLFRAIIHNVFKNNENLIPKDLLTQKEAEAIQLIKQQVEETANFCKQNNIKYVLLLTPTPAEIIEPNTSKQTNFLKGLGNQNFVINMFEPLNKYYLNQPINQYSWKLNGHFNSKGYWVLGQAIYNEVNLNDSSILSNN